MFYIVILFKNTIKGSELPIGFWDSLTSDLLHTEFLTLLIVFTKIAKLKCNNQILFLIELKINCSNPCNPLILLGLTSIKNLKYFILFFNGRHKLLHF